MYYRFTRGDEEKIVKCPMKWMDQVQRGLEDNGWRREWDMPNFSVRPTYSEAVNESAELADAVDRKMAADRNAATLDVAQALKDEIRSGDIDLDAAS